MYSLKVSTLKSQARTHTKTERGHAVVVVAFSAYAARKAKEEKHEIYAEAKINNVNKINETPKLSTRSMKFIEKLSVFPIFTILFDVLFFGELLSDSVSQRSPCFLFAVCFACSRYFPSGHICLHISTLVTF